MDLGRALFPGCASLADVEAAIQSEAHATARNTFVSIRRLAVELGVSDVSELYRRCKDVVAWINSDAAPPSPASKLTFYSALAAASRAVPALERAPATKMFLAESKALGKLVREDRAGSRLDARERAAILPWPVITRAYKLSSGKLDDEQSIIAALYLAGGDDPAGAPRRLDYNALRVFVDKAPARIPAGLNYVIVRSPSNVELVLQEFKTKKHYGSYRTGLPSAVSRVIHGSVKRRPREWLLHDDSGKPLTPSGFGRRVSATMKKITGKPIGVSNLRKSFVTWLYSSDGVAPDRLHEFAAAMNHSPSEQLAYRRKHIRA